MPRPRLVQALGEGLARRLILVCAPAGSGKTTLLADWAPSGNRPDWPARGRGCSWPRRAWLSSATAWRRQVFLMSRIKERYDQAGSTREAVIDGVSSTVRIITGAALIIVVVFSGFARGQLVMFQQMGFGVAVALLLDATPSAWSSCPAP